MNAQVHAVLSRANDPGVLHSGTIRSTRDLIYTRTDYVNVLQLGNKHESGKAKERILRRQAQLLDAVPTEATRKKVHSMGPVCDEQDSG